MFIQHPTNINQYLNLSAIFKFTIDIQPETRELFDGSAYDRHLRRYINSSTEVLPEKSKYIREFPPHFHITLYYNNEREETIPFNNQQHLDQFLHKLVPTKATL